MCVELCVCVFVRVCMCVRGRRYLHQSEFRDEKEKNKDGEVEERSSEIGLLIVFLMWLLPLCYCWLVVGKIMRTEARRKGERQNKIRGRQLTG